MQQFTIDELTPADNPAALFLAGCLKDLGIVGIRVSQTYEDDPIEIFPEPDEREPWDDDDDDEDDEFDDEDEETEDE